MKDSIFKLSLLMFIMIFSCDRNYEVIDNPETSETIISKSISILSLGDSHTIGKGICETCPYPEQLKQDLRNLRNPEDQIDLTVVAETGWTTSDLISQISSRDMDSEYNLVTLLIGVNNQYQNGLFSLFEKEFPELVDKAITFAGGNSERVVVLSIPDYAYTPFGQNWVPDPQVISDEIDAYNSFAKAYCDTNNISFVDITDISREGLDNPDIVADDDLHLSRLAHARITERLLPLALLKIE